MEVGILTYHRVHNYGAILQAIALRFVLQQMGHDVKYIDYYPEYHRRLYKQFSWSLLLKWRRKYLFNRIKCWKSIHKRIACFLRDINKHISPFCIPYNSLYEYDIIIYGSDQIWRKQNSLKNFNPVYFGDNTLQAKKHITYAASMGILQKSVSDKAFLQKNMSNFSAISVRESGLKDYLAELGVQATLVSDPTLLLSANQWDDILSPQPVIKTGYILYYSLHENAFDRDAINDYAKAHHLRVVEIKGKAGKDTDTVFSQCAVWEFVSLIKYADCVFTTSYHGLIFSLIYHKEFYCAFQNNSDRAHSLLSHLQIEERLLQNRASTIPAYPPIHYPKVDALLEKQKTKSYQFLYENVQ